MMSLVIGIKFGQVESIIKKAVPKKQAREIMRDLRYAGEEVLDYLLLIKPSNFQEIEKGLNDWIAMEANTFGGQKVKYIIGEGENIFEKIAIERALYYIKKDKK